MKNFTDNDYALNKNSESIVYRFTDGIVEVTLADFLAENPDKSIADFQKLKKESDEIYFEQDRNENSQTYKNTLVDELEKNIAFCEPSPEEFLINAIDAQEKAKNRKKHLTVAIQALDKLTDIQRRRYLLYVVDGLTTRKIAKKEGVAQRTVMDSLEWAEKKIKKFLANS